MSQPPTPLPLASSPYSQSSHSLLCRQIEPILKFIPTLESIRCLNSFFSYFFSGRLKDLLSCKDYFCILCPIHFTCIPCPNVQEKSLLQHLKTSWLRKLISLKKYCAVNKNVEMGAKGFSVQASKDSRKAGGESVYFLKEIQPQKNVIAQISHFEL